MVFAGGGGGQNLCQSNWIRDKGFGMGHYVPRLVSPITGVEEAAPERVSYVFEPTPANMARWRRWWRFANVEQALTFAAMTIVTICLTSMLAHSLVYGQPGLPNSVAFLRMEADALAATVGAWFGGFFLAVGAFSLFGAAMGIIDYTSRLAADVIKTTYLASAATSESRIYFALVWGLVAVGCLILIVGAAQPLPLLIISATVGGGMMFIYSMLMIVINKRLLPKPIRVRGFRTATLVWATALFGTLAVLTAWQQIGNLFRS
jgi:hypothetical protein